ncbi:alkaline phosphatase family protein [Cellulophaga sp. HaHaR_3_176]|uniref:alkaline phosphatase D family protein n=1 Tax=Cellulophaga sp. HaHaR_3_176 TaxID=1942464 RepID=UPI001C1F91B9|nr:alkaline phosphatase D family protein [Cellulophaga sp. HaHaR_3_176]QWX82486.1 alkaline phosphatase family protein [Cellulophaga sp. HaHaR_3_176]
MKFFGVLGSVVLFLSSFLSFSQVESNKKDSLIHADFTIAFGSCNKHNVDNVLWDDVLNTNPDVWIWGGDIIYADTNNMKVLRATYEKQNLVSGYVALKNKVPVIGTWDDHDYGLNDGGVEYKSKKSSQEEFLNFMGVAKDSPRRSQEGVYAVHTYKVDTNTIKVIVLDTRYFRTALTKDTETKKRNKPNAYGKGSVLGETQWHWLENELETSDADFNVIVSSIQILSNEHGFETWGNFPHEVDKLEKMIADSKAKGVMILSGDRHISEFSKTKVEALAYPLIDFTSSGLTHSYSAYSGETNPYRVGEVTATVSFGTLDFNFRDKKVVFKIVGDNGELLNSLEQEY